LGWQAFSVNYLFNTPESLLWAIVGEFITPLVNRNALKANYFSAIAEQNKTAYMYEQRVINAYMEVANQQANIINLENAYNLKKQ
jgi:outer membrane protein TolC